MSERETTPDRLEPQSLLEQAIIGWFGERCPDFAEGCAICDAWAELDVLRAEAART